MGPRKKIKDRICYAFIILCFCTLIFYSSYSKTKLETGNSYHSSKEKDSRHSHVLSPSNSRHSKARTYCNAPANIRLGHEGEVPSHYGLIGMLALVRHGDRGPLQPIRNLSSINCGYKSSNSDVYKTYVAVMLNVSRTENYINAVGNFMQYPILPSSKICSLGHLTPVGVLQNIQLGKILKSIYVEKFGLLRYPWKLSDIEVYSTKYRRTFQSGLAFLYSFLPLFDLSQIKWKQEKHVSFCGNYCGCNKVSYYEQKHAEELLEYRKSHPGVTELIQNLNSIIKQSASDKDLTNPFVMRDALLTYACHGAKLPCLENKCIAFEDLGKLLAFEEWQARQRRTHNQLRGARLRAYGILTNIKSYIKKMIHNGKPKVVLYFGHDLTITNLLTSLGIPYFQSPHYSSRVIFEIYANTFTQLWDSNSRDGYQFRILYNGKDITKLLPFCRSRLKKIPSDTGKKATISLCGWKSFEDYLETNSYFKDFNVTNFYSACDTKYVKD